MDKRPLVTVAAITYNSAPFVEELLDSITAQTYDRIELIISDDGSHDDTVEVCRRWLGNHAARFERSEIITTERNTGISPNNNRALRAATGEWFKGIAGDDLLLPECIATYVAYAATHPEAHFLFSGVEPFGDISIETHSAAFWDRKLAIFRGLPTARAQYQYLLRNENFAPAASAFMKTETLRKLGGFDEQIRMLEDYPLWIRATRQGYKLSLLPGTLVKYRAHGGSIQCPNPKFELSGRLFAHKYTYRTPFFAALAAGIDPLNPGNPRNKRALTTLNVLSLPMRASAFLRRKLRIKTQ